MHCRLYTQLWVKQGPTKCWAFWLLLLGTLNNVVWKWQWKSGGCEQKRERLKMFIWRCLHTIPPNPKTFCVQNDQNRGLRCWSGSNFGGFRKFGQFSYPSPTFFFLINSLSSPSAANILPFPTTRDSAFYPPIQNTALRSTAQLNPLLASIAGCPHPWPWGSWIPQRKWNLCFTAEARLEVTITYVFWCLGIVRIYYLVVTRVFACLRTFVIVIIQRVPGTLKT